jgi:hypothetical protein
MSYVNHISQPEAPRLTQERDAQYWLDLAQGARLQAEQVIYADSRRETLQIAAAYDNLAKLADERTSGKKSHA